LNGKLLEAFCLNKRFNGIKALDNFSASVRNGVILGLIGPNGAGKTTLFNVLTKFLPFDNGSILLEGKDITGDTPNNIANLGISRTFQNLRLIKQITVLENVMLAFKNQPGEYLFNVFFRNNKVKEAEKVNKKRALVLLESAGLAAKVYDIANDLSYGQQKILSIVCCLASDGNLMLFDEPVAGVNPVMIDKIIKIIADLPKQGKSAIIIEHNMDVINQICDRVIAMDSGKKICEGTPEEVRNDPRVIESYLG
jgi:ABC-type branched-subunit amino acid transport system ATPase component